MKQTFACLGRTALWGAVVLGLCLALASAFADGAAPTSDSGGTGTTIQLKDAPVAEVIKMLTTALGANVIMTDAVKGTVTVESKDRRPEEVLGQICAAYNLRWYRDEHGAIIVTGKAEAGSETAAAPAEVKPLDTAPSPSEEKRAMISLGYAEAEELAYQFGGADQPLSQRYRNWEQYQLTSALGAGAQMFNTMKNSSGLLGGASSGLPGGEANGIYRELNSYGSMNQYTLPGTYVPGVTGVGPTPGGGTTTTTPGGQQIQVPGASGPLAPLLPKGLTGPPIAFAPLNALLVQGTEEAIEEFRKLVAMLDVKVKQVEIEAQFVEMRVEDSRAFGVDWSWLGSEVTADAGISPGGGTFLIQYGKGNFAATLSALLQTARARIVSAPRVTTLNSYPASITFAKTTPIFLSTSVVQPGISSGQVITGTQLVFLPVASNLFVVPHINGDGSITTFITPTIADTAGTVTGPNGQSVPIPTSQSMQTMLTVKSGETIVMGGFITKKHSTSKNKIPLLSDIPIIGSLFVGSSEQVTDSETLIFLTPRIVPEATAGAATTGVVVP